MVLADLKGNDVILCQITSQGVKDDNSITIELSDIDNGTLNMVSNARPNRLFTADESIISYKIGNLNASKMASVVKAVVEMFEG